MLWRNTMSKALTPSIKQRKLNARWVHDAISIWTHLKRYILLILNTLATYFCHETHDFYDILRIPVIGFLWQSFDNVLYFLFSDHFLVAFPKTRKWNFFQNSQKIRNHKTETWKPSAHPCCLRVSHRVESVMCSTQIFRQNFLSLFGPYDGLAIPPRGQINQRRWRKSENFK